MIYNGKQASIKMQDELRVRIKALNRPPQLAILSVGTHRSTISFVKIKKNYASEIGVAMKEINFPADTDQAELIRQIASLAEDGIDGIVVQLPLPPSYDTRAVLDSIPENLDVDVLGGVTVAAFERAGTPVPPVAGAVAHILEDADINIEGKNVVVVGRGRLVGTPVATWFMHRGTTPRIIDINTDEKIKLELFKEADIVVSGVGSPKMLKPEYLKKGVVLIDAGTSEQSGVLSGDCDPACAKVASVLTPVPGGVGPLTVACLFENLITSAERNKK
jgi:methylenetetrahydrofolate dehydrogenase (NADP+) / methenyltetrahydrofolate cyclohydrolase